LDDDDVAVVELVTKMGGSPWVELNRNDARASREE